MFPMQYGSQSQSMMPYSSGSCGCSNSQSNNGVGIEQYINLVVANNLLQFQNMGLYNQLKQFSQNNQQQGGNQQNNNQQNNQQQGGNQQNNNQQQGGNQQQNRDNNASEKDGKLKTCEEENKKLKASMQELQKNMEHMKREVTTNTESMKNLLDKANKEKLELTNKLKEYESKNK